MRPAVLLLLLAAAAASASPAGEGALPPLQSNGRDVEVQGLTSYGNWCGGGHGGYQDCCGGGRCPACNPNDYGVTEDCLAECPPVDEVDMQCAHHDYCCFQNDKPSGLECSPQGNRCACDCKLVNGVNDATCSSFSCSEFVVALTETFRHVLSCFYYTSPYHDVNACTKERCSLGWCNDCTGTPKCNDLLGSPLDTFCVGKF